MIPVLLLSLVFACADRTVEPPSLPDDGADIVIAADLNGDGNDELVAITGEQVSWRNETHP